MHKVDSLRKRYFFKLFSNVFGQGVSVVVQAIAARGLGPRSYGDFNLLTNFFTQVMSFLDMGSSLAFYTKLSQRVERAQIVIFYKYYALAASLLAAGIVLIMHISSVYSCILPGQGIFYIYCAAIFGILSWITGILNKMTDAYGMTAASEAMRVIQKFVALSLIASLYFLKLLSLNTYFYYQYVTLGILGLLFILIMERSGYRVLRGWKIPFLKVRSYAKEFYTYCNPLATAVAFTLAASVLDRWLLQIFGGSEQQGFFGLSYQIGLFCILFTSAMTPLFVRELSVAHGNNDKERMRDLFHKHIPLLYSITAFIACFFSTQADRVVCLIGGNKYGSAVAAVAIMSLYPIHQTYGQLSSSLVFATGQTRLYRNMEMISSVLGLALTYLLLAPYRLWGMNAGATGLAVKMVVINFAVVNVFLFLNAKFLSFSFWHFFKHQMLSAGALMLAGLAARLAVSGISAARDVAIVGILLSGIVYIFIVSVIFSVHPDLFGVSRETLKSAIARVGDIAKRRG